MANAPGQERQTPLGSDGEVVAGELRIDSPHEPSSAEAHVRPKRSRRKKAALVPNEPSPSAETSVPPARLSPDPADPCPTDLAPDHGEIESPPSAEDLEALAIQVRQLLRHLAARHRALRRRRKRLLTQREELEARIRSVQLAFDQRELALADRHRQLDQWEERLALREQVIAEREEALAVQEAKLAERTLDLTSAQEALAAERKQLEDHFRQQLEELHDQFRLRAKELEEQQHHWQSQYQIQVERLRQAQEALAHERQQFERYVAFERQKLAVEQARIVEIHRLLRAQVDKHYESALAALAQRRQELETLAAEVKHRQSQLVHQQQELKLREERLAQKVAQLEDLRLALAEALAQTERLREQLQIKYGMLTAEAESERLRAKQQYAEQVNGIRECRERLLRLEEQLTRREALLADFQSELEAAYAQLFRERLLVEELSRRWLQQVASQPLEEDTVKKLQEFIRRIAAEISRPEEVENIGRKLQEQLLGLETLRDRLASELASFSERRQKWEAWSQARASQLAEAQNQLRLRLCELQRREQALEDLGYQWELQKAFFRQEILRLRLEMLSSTAQVSGDYISSPRKGVTLNGSTGQET